jgi:glycosyltransferase involved in cell wall biosynthesis
MKQHHGLNAVTVSVIVPAFNEDRTIVSVLEAVRAQHVPGVSFEVLIVDDGSTDDTLTLLRDNPQLYDRLITLPDNRGKGAAVRAGLEAATGEVVLFQDADLEYDPAEFETLLGPVLHHDAELVIGSRMLGPRYTRVHYFWHKLGNSVITLLFNILNNTTFTDVYSGYLLFRRRLLDPAELATRGWEQQAEILGKTVGRAEKIYEVPVSYAGRTYAEGKKIKAYHAAAIIWVMLRVRLFGRHSRTGTGAAAKQKETAS